MKMTNFILEYFIWGKISYKFLSRNGYYSSTIVYTIDVRRQFMPGNYVLHVVGPDTTLDKTLHLNYNSAIICREDVDPKLIHELLIDSNCFRNGEHPELSKNFISRYDWMHFRNWGDEETSDDEPTSNDDSIYDIDLDGSEDTNEEKFKKIFKRTLKAQFNCKLRDLVFFINVRKIDDITAGKFIVERESESIFLMMNNSLPEPVIGFVINTESDTHSFIAGDWNYACLLTDKNSKQNFAFVFGDLYVNKYHSCEDDNLLKYDIQKEQFTYNIENFLYK